MFKIESPVLPDFFYAKNPGYAGALVNKHQTNGTDENGYISNSFLINAIH